MARGQRGRNELADVETLNLDQSQPSSTMIPLITAAAARKEKRVKQLEDEAKQQGDQVEGDPQRTYPTAAADACHQNSTAGATEKWAGSSSARIDC